MAEWGPTNIQADGDDGYDQGGSWTSAAALWLGKNDNVAFVGGFRWDNITVPKNATINTATLTIRAAAGDTVTGIQHVVRAEDTDDAAAWGVGSYPSNVSTWTTAGYNWRPTGTATGDVTDYAMDVKDVVQEIVNRAGWTSGQAMRFAFLDDSSTNGVFLRVYDYTGSTSLCAKLYIDYTEAAAGAAKAVLFAPIYRQRRG